MARHKSYQKGCVVKRKRKSGVVFLGRYRIRNPERKNGWEEKTVTLTDCRTMKAAHRAFDGILDKLNKGDGCGVRSEVSFAHVVDQLWPNYLDTGNVKPSTRHAYGVMATKWIRPYFEDMLLGDVRPSDVGTFMASLRDKGLSAQYRLDIYAVLKVLFDLAVEYDLLEVTPVRPKVHRPQVVRTEKPVFSVEAARAILDAVPAEFRPAIATLAVTGLRAGKLAAIRWRDVDFLNQTIAIRASVWRGTLQRTKTRSTQPSCRCLGSSSRSFTGIGVFPFLRNRKTSCFVKPTGGL